MKNQGCMTPKQERKRPLEPPKPRRALSTGLRERKCNLQPKKLLEEFKEEENIYTALLELDRIILPTYLDSHMSKVGFVASLTVELAAPSIDPKLILFATAKRATGSVCLFVCKMGIGALKSRNSSHLLFFHSFQAIESIVDHSVVGRIGWSLLDGQEVWFDLGTRFEAALFLSRVVSLHQIPMATRLCPCIL